MPTVRRQARTTERYTALRQLLSEGKSLAAIGRQLRLDHLTVRRFVRARSLYELLVKDTNRTSILDGHKPYLHQRWREGCHDLRHSTATLLLEQGVELVVINEFLGHAHIGVTPRCTPTYASASSARRSTSSEARSATGPTTETIRRLVQHPSADVAVNYCRQNVMKSSLGRSREDFMYVQP